MQFTVIKSGDSLPATARNLAYLLEDGRDDGKKYTTRYTLYVYDGAGSRRLIGDVKIGERGMKSGRPSVPNSFPALPDEFFSLGQSDTYYERLKELKKATRESILSSLKDIAAEDSLFEQAKSEPVTAESLLATVPSVTAIGHFRRLAQGRARITTFQFKYTSTVPEGIADDDIKPVELTFRVARESYPPTNIHALIGPNGVGKTHILEHMARALMDSPEKADKNGVFEHIGKSETDAVFANVVSVTFSAFDPFDPLPDRRGETEAIRYSYVGLKSTSKTSAVKNAPKNLSTLTTDFGNSLVNCAIGSKAERWREAVKTLEADQNFRDADVSALLGDFGDEEEPGFDWKVATAKLRDDATALFFGLSTGHKIVLLTITRLVETVEERTLVLFDEPESHLHPPLLSAFIRALSNLLAHRNGVAIVATHSPVVLQEVPKACTWQLNRIGSMVTCDRPEAETFGENVGSLTRSVFGLEVTHSGFHAMLREHVAKGGSYEAIVEDFSSQLGAEARALLRTLLANKNNSGE